MAAEEVGRRMVTGAKGVGHYDPVKSVTEHNASHPSNSQSTSPRSRTNVKPQHSNSMPTTPHINGNNAARQFRTPSPIDGQKQSSSARSARSEPDNTARTSGRPFPTTCQYETGIMNFKRRMPYSLGSDKLESSPVKVKKHLEPDEEKKITKEMNEMFNKLQPTKESAQRRIKFVKKLEMLLNERWPGNEIKVHVFGSSGNSLFTNDSDVDICITTKTDALKRTCSLAKALGDYGMQNIECRPNAKVPIVKMWDPQLELACDMNVNNTAALHNTKMMKAYVQMDPRVQPLAMIIKYWTRRRILNDAALGGTLSSYTWLCMIINFLQTRNLKILPSLQKPPFSEFKLDDPYGFDAALEATKDFGKANRESLGQLLFGFFRRYAHEIDFERNVISIREGELIPKQDKRWHPSQNTRLCVEEPFNVDRNLGNTADDTSFRGVHLEIRRAFDLISQGKLEECFAEYEFPPQEERLSQNQHIFTKPTPQPRPVLTRSQSQTGSNRIPRTSTENKKTNVPGQKQKQGTSNRRASSAIPPHKNSTYPMSFIDVSASGSQLHESLAHQYQKLQRQEQQLRAKMQHQVNLPNQMYAMFPNGNAYYIDSMSQGNSDMGRRHSNVGRSPQQVPMQQFTPLTNVPGIANFLPPGFLSNTVASHQTHTNPPSPSLTHAQLGYRGSTRRTSTVDSNQYGNTRSHSQPPANNTTVPQQQTYAYPDMYMSPEWQVLMPGQRSLQDIQHDYLQNRQRRYANDDGAYSVNSADTQHFDSPTGGSEFDPNSMRMGGISQDDSNLDVRYSQTSRSATLPYAMTTRYEQSQNRVANDIDPTDYVNSAETGRRSRPRASSTVAAHGISFFADATVDSPEQQFILPVRKATWKDSHASFSRRVRGDFEIRDGSEASDYGTQSEQSNDLVQIGSTYSSDAVMTPGSSAATPTRESSDMLTENPAEKNPISQPLPPSIQFGQFPARAPYRITHQPKPDDIRGSTISQGHGRGLYSHTLSGLGIHMNNGVPSRENTMSNASGTANQSSTVAGLNLASTLKTGSILSPVREVRTPSPTTTRSSRMLMMSQSRSGLSLNRTTVDHEQGSSSSASAAASASRTKTHDRARSVESIRGQTSNQNGSPSSGRSDKTQTSPPPAKPIPNGRPQEQSSRTVQAQSQMSSQNSQQPQQQQGGWQQSGTGRKKKNKKSASVGSIAIPLNDEERKGG